jgi:transposase-like protein
MEQFSTHESCIAYLEQIRWKNGACCPHCGSVRVRRKKDGERVGRWNCHDCHASFNVLAKTLFQGTKVPLQKWFLAIALIVNAKKSLSSCQLARDLGLNQKTVWYMMTRIRAEMAREEPSLLQGIIEADETYVGGKPRKGNKREDDVPSKRGRGTKKKPVIGVIQRGGKVIARLAKDLTSKGILKFINDTVNVSDSTLVTDEFRAYNAVNPIMKHAVIKHSERYVDGETHTNTIEGFWSLLKRAWYGQHHHYSKKYLPLYVAEACYKYNHRHTKSMFDVFLRGCFAAGSKS